MLAISVEETKVIKRFKPFILGFCLCGCGDELKSIRDRCRQKLKFYLPHHHRQPKINKLEYRRIYRPNHPHADKKGCIRYHRLVMEEKLGRYLEPWEVVDHINKDRQDNRPDNLRLFSSNSAHISNHKPKSDWSWVRCSKCGTNETFVSKRGNPNWYSDKNGGYLCFKCWHIEYYNLKTGKPSLLSRKSDN